MVLTTFWRRLPLATLALTILTACPGAAQSSSADDPGIRAMQYYKSPDASIVDDILAKLDKISISGRNNAHGSTVGFLSEVLRLNRGLAAKFAAQEYSGNGRRIMVDSLWFAGETERAAAYAQRAGLSEKFIEHLREQPATIKVLPIRGSNDLDLHWGAFFASGDIDYVAKIADVVETSAKTLPVGKIISYAGRISRKAHTQDMNPWIQSLDRPSQWKFILATTALWALGSNAQRHPNIANYVAARAGKDEGAQAAPAMQWIGFRLKSPQTIVSGNGTNARILMMAGKGPEIGTMFIEQARSKNSDKAAFGSQLVKEMPAAQPLFISYIVIRTTPCEGEARLTVSGPENKVSGADSPSWSFPPSTLKAPGKKSSIVLQTVKIEGDRLARPGTYLYSLSLKVCDETIGPVQNGLFVY
jgi:hypothetical protein